jgi:hypothetical protein
MGFQNDEWVAVKRSPNPNWGIAEWTTNQGQAMEVLVSAEKYQNTAVPPVLSHRLGRGHANPPKGGLRTSASSIMIEANSNREGSPTTTTNSIEETFV